MERGLASLADDVGGSPEVSKTSVEVLELSWCDSSRSAILHPAAPFNPLMRLPTSRRAVLLVPPVSFARLASRLPDSQPSSQ